MKRVLHSLMISGQALGKEEVSMGIVIESTRYGITSFKGFSS